MKIHALLVVCSMAAQAAAAAGEPGDFVIAVHGGAGTIERDSVSPEREAAYHAALETALRAGWTVLDAGGSALDAVTAAVRVMEDEPLFNAGRGAVFTSDGRNELDAAIMDGRTRNAGAVAGITRIRNPIDLARAVMEHSRHVMMIGEGAETYAAELGFEFVDAGWFRTEHRWRQLERVRGAERDQGAAAWSREDAYGTVGAVARDRHGDLAAATSTGGLTNKRWGRVGDVPVVGAGTYADNRSAAISATGHGESFIRAVAAHEIAARVRLQGTPLAAAARSVLEDEVGFFGGDGGVIGVDRHGNVALEFSSSGMYRGYMTSEGDVFTAIFAE